MFQGQRYDEESGLYYFKNRYYDPETGRFITRDPSGMVDGPNLYAFVNNNPINYVDPLGQMAVIVEGNVEDGQDGTKHKKVTVYIIARYISAKDEEGNPLYSDQELGDIAKEHAKIVESTFNQRAADNPIVENGVKIDLEFKAIILLQKPFSDEEIAEKTNKWVQTLDKATKNDLDAAKYVNRVADEVEIGKGVDADTGHINGYAKDSVDFDYEVAHEFGHIMGLHDEYPFSPAARSWLNDKEHAPDVEWPFPNDNSDLMSSSDILNGRPNERKIRMYHLRQILYDEDYLYKKYPKGDAADKGLGPFMRNDVLDAAFRLGTLSAGLAHPVNQECNPQFQQYLRERILKIE
jgi:RHS repeat-associated protein